MGQRFALSERKGGRKPRMEKGPLDVSWVPEPRGLGGVGGGSSFPLIGVARGRGLRSRGVKSRKNRGQG